MKLKKLSVILITFAFATSILTSIAYAQSSLKSGYRITTDHHGEDVAIGETVTAWADTTDNTTEKVIFIWIWNDTEVKRNVTINTYIIWYTGEGGWPEEPGLPNGTEVRRFTDIYQPDELGEWAVKAKFLNSYGQTLASDQDSFPVRATSFNVIPYTPLGTISIILLMICAFSIFITRKKHPQLNN